MKRVRVIFLIIVCILFFPTFLFPQGVATVISILPFENRSNYKGKANISDVIPRLLGEKLSELGLYQVVPQDSLQNFLKEQKVEKFDFDEKGKDLLKNIGNAVRADVLITGVISDFNMSRFGVGNPMIGGYGSYSASIEVKINLYRALDGQMLFSTVGSAKEVDRNVDITLLGKSTKKMLEFSGFQELTFSREELENTMIGSAINKALNNLVEKIREELSPPTISMELREDLSEPCILMVSDNMAYVNIGSDDGIRLGDKFVISTQKELKDPQTGTFLGHVEQRTGVIQIIQIEAVHLSKARILEGKDVIQVGNEVRAE